MADQHNANIPALTNTIAADIPDIKENLEFHKDVFENFVGAWSNTDATGIYPEKFSDTSATPVIWQFKVIDIGDWNMDSTDSVAVAHGLTLSKIRSVSVMIRNDAGTAMYPFASRNGDGEIGVTSIDGTNVNLERKLTSIFDGADFNSTSYNRGWVNIIATV